MLTQHVQRFIGFAAFGLALAAGASSVKAQCEAAKLVASDAKTSANLGISCSLSGDAVILGAPGTATVKGATYIYRKTATGWQQEVKLEDVTGADDDDYGRAVAISGNVAVVGADLREGLSQFGAAIRDAGAAFIYRKSGASWVEEAKLSPADLIADDKFGSSVAVDGDWAIVGTPLADTVTGQFDAGAAYAFRYNGTQWVQEQRIAANDGTDLDKFGSTVAMDGEWAFIGAPEDKIMIGGVASVNGPGSVYVFRRQGSLWQQIQRLNADVPKELQRFGISIGLRGNVAVIGDRVNAGQRAYVFRYDGNSWVFETSFTSSDFAADDQFGVSAAVNGDLILIGARLDDDGGSATGSVYVFQRSNAVWSQQTAKLFNFDRAIGDRFGACLALSDDFALIGASGKDSSKGSAYVFSVSLGDDCNNNGTNDECELRANPGLDTNQNGTIDTCECTTNASCNDNLTCTVDTCDLAILRCVHAVNAGSCVIGGQCIANGTVNPANGCQECNAATSATNWSSRADGTACTADASPCTNDLCQAGACAHPPAAAGTACGSANNTDCDNPDSCDGAGLCLNNLETNGASCANDNLFCTGVETCQSGLCTSAGNPCAATPLTPTCDENLDLCVVCLVDGDCVDANPCTNDLCILGDCQHPFSNATTTCGDPANTDCTDPDTCNGAGACVANHAANGTVCASDGMFCNGAEACVNGACVSSNINPCAATPLTPTCDEAGDRCVFCLNDAACNDNNECTDDVCGPTGLCTSTVVLGRFCGGAAGAADTDCTDPDTCSAAGVCQPNHAANGIACTNDSLFCTGTETCGTGVCVSSGDPCTAGTMCNETADKCDCTDNAQCGDGIFCNGPETCSNGTCATGAAPCTGVNKICLEASDTCVQCSVTADCQDNQFCTGTETCVNNACVATGNPCTTQGLTCNEATDKCDCNDDGDCSDGLFCNGPEKCVGGQCVASVNPCPASQECDERGDRCLECLTGADCDDDDPCTADTCPGGVCTHTPLAGCRDADLDGVENDDDDCPGTPGGAAVNASGCAASQRDADRDGITDDVDRCPRTPTGQRVNAVGCSPAQADDDGDAVTNVNDLCPGTAADAEVDDAGCAVEQRDDDGDGVPNGADTCAETPAGEAVNSFGCADSQIDSDGDGVFDNADLCPNTAAETDIDAVGCPIPVQPPPPTDNGNDNSGEPPAGDPVPTGTGTGLRLCGAVGMMGWFFLLAGLVGMGWSARRR